LERSQEGEVAEKRIGFTSEVTQWPESRCMLISDEKDLFFETVVDADNEDFVVGSMDEPMNERRT